MCSLPSDISVAVDQVHLWNDMGAGCILLARLGRNGGRTDSHMWMQQFHVAQLVTKREEDFDKLRWY